MEKIREFLNSTAGKAVSFAIVALALVWAGIALLGAFGGSEAATGSRERTFICAETGKVFDLEIDAGLTVPVLSPYSDKATGWPVEYCDWTKEGGVRSERVPVLLNDYLGKNEPTFCPDCGRLVIVRNPAAAEGVLPPPTKDQFSQSRNREN